MSFLTDARFNSLTVLLGVVLTSAVTYYVSRKPVPPPAPGSRCDFKSIKGTMQSSPTDRWNFELDRDGKARMTHANGLGFGSGSGPFTVVCDRDRIMFKRWFDIYSGPRTLYRTCYHEGLIQGGKVHGDFACQEVMPGPGERYVWDAEIFN